MVTVEVEDEKVIVEVEVDVTSVDVVVVDVVEDELINDHVCFDMYHRIGSIINFEGQSLEFLEYVVQC